MLIERRKSRDNRMEARLQSIETIKKNDKKIIRYIKNQREIRLNDQAHFPPSGTRIGIGP